MLGQYAGYPMATAQGVPGAQPQPMQMAPAGYAPMPGQFILLTLYIRHFGRVLFSPTFFFLVASRITREFLGMWVDFCEIWELDRD